jgi:hypothetical protein
MKSNTVKLVSFFIAVSGLVSCSPDKPVQDRLDIHAPVVLRPGQYTTWDSFIGSEDRSLDLADIVQFEHTEATKLNVKVNCDFGSGIAQDEVTLKFEDSIRVSDFFSDRMLSHFGTNMRPICKMDFVAQNANGSTRSFNFQFVQITNVKQINQLYVTTQDMSPIAPEQILASENGNNLIRTKDLQEHDQFRLQCTDAHFDLQSYQEQVSIVDFDFKNPIIDTTKENYSSLPVQRCRAFAYLREKRVGMSPTFSLILSDRMPSVIAEQEKKAPGVQEISEDRNLLYRSFVLHNPMPSELVLKIPKLAPSFSIRLAQFTILLGMKNDPLITYGSTMAEGFIKLDSTATIIKDLPSSWLIKMYPNQKLRIEVRTQLKKLTCPTEFKIAEGHAIKPLVIYLRAQSGGVEMDVPLLPIDLHEPISWGEPMAQADQAAANHRVPAECP